MTYNPYSEVGAAMDEPNPVISEAYKKVLAVPAMLEGLDNAVQTVATEVESIRQSKVKIDDWTTPLALGAEGDGLSDDTAFLEEAATSGKHLVIPPGMKFKSNSKVGIQLVKERQILELNGDILYSGTQHNIGGGYSGFFSVVGAVNTHGLEIIGKGRIKGAWDGVKVSVNGKVGTGIWLANCHGALIDGPQIEDFYGECMKLFNCPENIVRRATKLYHSRNMACEVKSYAANPYVGTLDGLAGFLGLPWEGTPAASSGFFDALVEWIDDDRQGGQNGCGFDFSILPGAPDIPYYDIQGIYRDVLLPIWAENNDPEAKAFNIRVKAYMEGNIRGADVSECSDGVGFINVHSGSIDVDIINQTNIIPIPGSETVGVNLVNCQDIDVNMRLKMADIPEKMQHAIKLSGSHRIKIRGRQEGVSGISDQSPAYKTPILFSTINAVEALNTDIDIAEFDGGDAERNWEHTYVDDDDGLTYEVGGGDNSCSLPAGLIPMRFSLSNVPANQASNLLSGTGTGFDKLITPCAGRLVRVLVRVNNSPAAVNSIQLTAANGVTTVPITDLAIDAASFAGDFTAIKGIEARDAIQLRAGVRLECVINTAAIPAGLHIEVTYFFDPRWKR